MTRNNFADGAEFSAEGLDAIVNAHDNEGFLSGGAPSVGTGNFDVDLTAADYVINQTDYSTGADTVTLSNPSASDRVDIITATNTPGFNVTEGTPATDPNAPTIPTDEVLIAAVFVDSGAASLASGDINDYRVFLERDAVTFKGNDIDTDGDGKVNDADAADLADDSNQLGGLAPLNYEPFVTSDNFSELNTATASLDNDGTDKTPVNISGSGFLLNIIWSEGNSANVQVDVTIDGGPTQSFNANVSDFQTNAADVGMIPSVRYESSLRVDFVDNANSQGDIVVYYL